MFCKARIIPALFFSFMNFVLALLLTLSKNNISTPSYYYLMQETMPFTIISFISCILIWKNSHHSIFRGGMKGFLIGIISILLALLIANIFNIFVANSLDHFIRRFQTILFWMLIVAPLPIVVNSMLGLILTLLMRVSKLKHYIKAN